MPSTARSLIQQAGGLANQSDLARRWGISRQAVSEYIARASFPQPVGDVGGRPVYLVNECDEWRARQRRPPVAA